MRKLKKKSTRIGDICQSKPTPQQQIFHKVSSNFSKLPMRPSQHNKIVTTIKEQMKRPETSKTLKKDYRTLMNLADCNGRIIASRERSIMSYKKMRNINNDNRRYKYQPLFAEIQNTETQLCRKKYKKYDLENAAKTLDRDEEDEDNFLQNALFQGMRDIKAYIPCEAKLHKKMNIFGEMLQEQKHRYVEDIKKLVMREKSKGGEVSKGFQIYLVNHYLIQKLMVKMFQDSSSALKLKSQNAEIYSQIKREMVGEIIKEKNFWQILADLHEHDEDLFTLMASKNRNSVVHRRRLAQSKVKHKRYGSEMTTEMTARGNKGKENQITIQFEKIYEETKEKLAEAQLQLNFVTNRKHNFYSMIQLKKGMESN